MADEYIIQSGTLEGIADAIRTKTGNTGEIPVSDMKPQILSIPNGPKVACGTLSQVTYQSGASVSLELPGWKKIQRIYINCQEGAGTADGMCGSDCGCAYSPEDLNLTDGGSTRLPGVNYGLAGMYWYRHILNAAFSNGVLTFTPNAGELSDVNDDSLVFYYCIIGE